MKLFVTSNQQFGRPGAINSYSRPFKDVDEMNKYMIQQWNSVVGKDDSVFVLGNFAWQPEVAEESVSQLNGFIYVMNGEWDQSTQELVKNKVNPKLHYLSEGIRNLPGSKMVLSYWPLVDWLKKKSGAVSFIGHPNKAYKTDHKKRIVNVACDRWDFKPIDASEMVKLYNDPDLSNKDEK